MSVKDLFLIPELDCASMRMIANYYEVDIHTVTICYNRNQSEIDSDGVIHKKYSELENVLKSQNVITKICHGKLEAQLSDKVTLLIPHTGLKLFSKRAVLRFGMLLRDSKIAKEDVMAWMIEKQMSKRNLSDKQKDYLQGKEYELNRCTELNILPCFGYTTFSNKENEPHFRLIFCADKVIVDRQKRDAVQKTLITLFTNADKVTFDCTRLFFGGRSLICDTYDNKINAEQIIDRYYNPTMHLMPKSAEGVKIETRTELAKLANVGHDTYDKGSKILKSDNENVPSNYPKRFG